jgi:hypothetical protein
VQLKTNLKNSEKKTKEKKEANTLLCSKQHQKSSNQYYTLHSIHFTTLLNTSFTCSVFVAFDIALCKRAMIIGLLCKIAQ